MKLGIVGLPNVGKSTLFNSLTKAGAESANYPFCTIDPNIGIVPVPDARLDVLAKMHNSAKIVPAAIEFVDIAGLVKGASKGEGLGNQFLSNIREVDAIIHVVRCFEDSNIVHVDGSIDPLRDIETINLELLFSDLEILERRYAKLVKSVKGDKTLVKEKDLVENLKKHLEDGKMAKSYETSDDEETILLESFNLLTGKPVIYAANVSENELADDASGNSYVNSVRDFAKNEGSDFFNCPCFCFHFARSYITYKPKKRIAGTYHFFKSGFINTQVIKEHFSLFIIKFCNFLFYLCAYYKNF